MNKIGKGKEDYILAPTNLSKIIVLFLFVVLLGSMICPITVLYAHNYRDDEYIKMWKISEGEKFLVEHTHSVQQTNVREMYINKKGKIILLESYFESLGAGLPATTPYKFELVKNGFRIYDINEQIEDLVYKAGAVRANHRIIIKGKKYYFLDFTQPRTGVKFQVRKVPVIYYLIKEGFK